MRKSCLNLHLVLVILFIFSVSGCAFGTRRPVLEYSAVTPGRAPNNIAIEVVPFQDNRPDKNVVGNVRNGWGIKTADVITDTNISDWITSALKAELTSAGYTVTEAGAANTIKGEVIKVYCDAFMNYEGEVMIKVALNKDGKELLDKVYSGKATDLNWAATAKSYGTILKRGLQQAMNQVIVDVDGALKE